MMKGSLLLLVVVGMAFILSGCGYWGGWGGHNHTSHNKQSHSHYQGCGHSGY